MSPVMMCLCTADVTVFSAVRALVFATYPGQDVVVPWDVVLVDTSGGFDSTKTVYTVPESGLYLTHFSAGIPPFSLMTVTLNGTTNSPNILMTHDSYNGEMMTSRDDIQWWDKGQRVQLTTNGTLYSDGMFPTSWSGRHLYRWFRPVRG